MANNNRKLSVYFHDYAQFHKTSGNRITHVFGIPMIVSAVTGLLNKIVLYDTGAVVQGSPGLLVFLLVAGFYLFLSPGLGLVTVIVMAILYFIGTLLPTSVLLGLFFLGWAFQYYGHLVYEKQSPAFYKNGLHLLIGPMYILHYYLIKFFRKN